MATVLVTGASGTSGSLVTQQLRALGVPVRALVRSLDARSDALRKLGAEVVVGDMGDFLAMRAAMQGCKRAYFCPPIDQFMVAMAVAFAAAARHAHVESVVVLSQWLGSHESPSYMSREHAMVDDLFASLAAHDIAVTILNPGFFADFEQRQADVEIKVEVSVADFMENRPAAMLITNLFEPPDQRRE